MTATMRQVFSRIPGMWARCQTRASLAQGSCVPEGLAWGHLVCMLCLVQLR